jgi:tRNA nucleotidyltransferase (CCA-adding enzyme)
MNFTIPSYTEIILKKLNTSGYEAYIVGGAVRDMIIGRLPKDWDIATDAEPNDVLNIFDKTVDTGIKHGTVTVLLEGKQVEVTTYRSESNYSDFRRPDKVEFVDNLAEDLSRRDFTINAIAYCPEEGVKDYNNGIEDIKNRIIRCVGNPDERFIQDALRMMRAVRFSCELNFQIEPLTLKSINQNASLINKISSERIREELNKILISEKPSNGINLLYETGLLNYIMPELADCKGLDQQNQHHIYDVYEHTLSSLNNVCPKLHLRLTMLMHDLGKLHTKTVDKLGIGHFYGHQEASAKIAANILKRLRYDNKISIEVTDLIRKHDYKVNPDKLSVRKAINKIGVERFQDWICVRQADIKAQSVNFMIEKLNNIELVQELFCEIIKEEVPLILKNLLVNGNDIKDIGIVEGKEIKNTLNYLMERVLEDPVLNERETLLNLAFDLYSKGKDKLK